MKLETEALLLRRDSGWRSALLCIAVTIAAILLLYRDTALSMVATWGSSDTYAHGFLIVPISVYLIWRYGPDLTKVTATPDALGFILLAAAGLVWLTAAAAQVQVLQQYAMTAMVPAAAVAILGRRVAWSMAFPLLFLLLAVPFGEAFLPYLMSWTADFTVAALSLTGIPVYREGTFFTIPSGQWSVVEACSGLRYLIASITIGTLYAYLTYQRWWKRAVCVAFSVLIPIGANFVRAYTVVMVGHLTNMKYAVGLDHIIYGWLFYGVVMLSFFWIGSYWRDPSPSAQASDRVEPGVAKATPAAVAVAGLVALAAVWPLYAAYLDRPGVDRVGFAAPAGAAGWVLEAGPEPAWSPEYVGPVATILVRYRKGERSVWLYCAHFRNQRQGAELVSSHNSLAGGHDSAWSVIGTAARAQSLRSEDVKVRETRLRSAGRRLLAWDWYWIAGRNVGDPYLAKALLARDKLLGRGDASSAIVIAAPYEARPEEAAETLRAFLGDMLPAVEAAIALAARGQPG